MFFEFIGWTLITAIIVGGFILVCLALNGDRRD